MPRFWTIVCYVIACVAFALAFLGIEITPHPLRPRMTYRAVNFVGLGLLTIAIVMLVDTLNT